MNSLNGHIIKVEVSGHLSIVTALVAAQLQLKAIVVETPTTASYLQAGQAIAMLFKETEVVIGTGDLHNISLQNKIPATILCIEQGTLLSKLTLATAAGNISSLISTNAVQQLGLKEQLKVTAMIKLNEVMLSEI
jgi:molybdopterin-binding protein